MSRDPTNRKTSWLITGATNMDSLDIMSIQKRGKAIVKHGTISAELPKWKTWVLPPRGQESRCLVAVCWREQAQVHRQSGPGHHSRHSSCRRYLYTNQHIQHIKETILQSSCSSIREALYGIEPSTRNSKIWPTREEAAPSVPKHILLTLNQTRTRASLFQSITEVSTTALSRITVKSHDNSYHAARLSCQLSQFCPPLGCATSSTSTRYF